MSDIHTKTYIQTGKDISRGLVLTDEKLVDFNSISISTYFLS